MNETTKTTVFVGVAAAALGVLMLLTMMSRTWDPELDPVEMIGKPLFADFDPLAVTDMEIIDFDEDTSTASSFQVAQVDGKWSIPSHANYPTDAEDQLADAASSVMGLTVISVEGDNPGDHELYGVLDPDPKTLKPGDTGVGSRVIMKDKDNKELLNLIIGKKVPARDELRYVRRVGQDVVYAVKVKTDKLSTKFEDWIEDDLLKLSTWDIRQLHIRDHSIDEAQGVLMMRGEMRLAYDDSGDPKWKMVEDKTFDQGQWVNVELAEDEELDTDKLNDMKSALDDLKIVDVQRKPEGLSGDLKTAEDFAQNADARASLETKGFYFAPVGDQLELYSNEGDVRCMMKDGVQYVLRFGNITGSAAAAAASEGEEADSDSPGMNRYIFVMAEFNPDAIEKPDYEDVPEVEEGAIEEGAEGEETDAEATDEAAEEKADEATDDANSEDASSEDASSEDGETEEKSEAEKERERIEKENKRKKDEYDEKIAAGKKKVEELNDRFSDWYYVISDEVYQKIHLGRDQIVKKKEKDEEDGDTEAASDTLGGTNDVPATDTTVEPEEEPAGPLEEFQNLKQEGPGGNE